MQPSVSEGKLVQSSEWKLVQPSVSEEKLVRSVSEG